MSFQLKRLLNAQNHLGAPVRDWSNEIASKFAMIPKLEPGVEAYVLYAAPMTPIRKVALVTSYRLFNTDTDQVTINLFFGRKVAVSSTGQPYPTRTRIIRKDFPVSAGKPHIDDTSLVLEPGDTIEGYASKDGVVQILINGVERDAL